LQQYVLVLQSFVVRVDLGEVTLCKVLACAERNNFQH
jgi:hypothetical protein